MAKLLHSILCLVEPWPFFLGGGGGGGRGGGWVGGGDSLFISVENCTRRIQFSYNYSMGFTYSHVVTTKQAGDTFCTRYYNLEDIYIICNAEFF